MPSIYDFSVTMSNGDEFTLENYKGKVMLIVNTASKCGFTPQFEGLQVLYDTYKDKGLVILGFPCGQFMKQEFDVQEEIMDFCQVNYGVTFPIFQKIDVKGKDAHPLYRYLTKEKKGLLGGEIKWNFTKFLIDQQGKVIKRYAPNTTPEKLEQDIKELLI